MIVCQVPEGMRIASPGPTSATFAIEFYLARALEDEIKLLRDLVIVPLCPASRGDARFRKALVLNGRIGAIENRTDSRAVLGDKRRLGRKILDGHSLRCRGPRRDGRPKFLWRSYGLTLAGETSAAANLRENSRNRLSASVIESSTVHWLGI